MIPTDSAYIEASKLNLPLLKVDKSGYSTNDLVAFLKTGKANAGELSTEYLNNRFNSFLLAKMNESKEQTLAEHYPDFRNLSNEYFDGILLFDIMNKEVWQKAEKDTLGLTKFFEANRSKYSWTKPKHKGYVIHCKDEATLSKAKAIVSQNKGNNNLPQLLSNLNDSIGKVTIEVGTWGEGDNAYIDKQFYGKDIKKEMKGYPLYFIEERTIAAPEDYTDVKGQIISDYQGTARPGQGNPSGKTRSSGHKKHLRPAAGQTASRYQPAPPPERLRRDPTTRRHLRAFPGGSRPIVLLSSSNRL